MVLEIAGRRGSIDDDLHGKLRAHLEVIAKMIRDLINGLKSRAGKRGNRRPSERGSAGSSVMAILRQHLRVVMEGASGIIVGAIAGAAAWPDGLH